MQEISGGKLFAETMRVSRANLSFIVIYLIAMLAIAVIQDLPQVHSLFYAQSLADAFLAIPAYKTVLGNRHTRDVLERNVIFSYVWRSLLLDVITLVVPTIIIVSFVRSGGSYTVSFYASLVAWTIMGSICFAIWGTILPATVVNYPNDFTSAYIRGTKTFQYSFWRLSISLGLTTVVQLAAATGIMMLMGSAGKFFTDGGKVDFAMVIATIVATMIGAIGIVATAIVLSRAFLAAESNCIVE